MTDHNCVAHAALAGSWDETSGEMAYGERAPGSLWIYTPAVPIISVFFGIVVRMFYQEHEPAHFHAEYQG